MPILKSVRGVPGRRSAIADVIILQLPFTGTLYCNVILLLLTARITYSLNEPNEMLISPKRGLPSRQTYETSDNQILRNPIANDMITFHRSAVSRVYTTCVSIPALENETFLNSVPTLKWSAATVQK